MNKRLTFRILFLLLLIISSVYIFIHFDLYLLFEDKPKLENFIRSYPYDQLIFILIQIIQVAAAPIPGEVTGFIGGIIYGPLWGTIYSTIGLTLGSWLAFMLARFFGMELLEKVIKPETIKKFDYFMEHQGILVSLLLFMIPGFPKDLLCYIMGVSRIPTRTFLIVSTAGRLPGTILLSFTGHYADDGQYILLAVILGVGIALSIAAYFYHDQILAFLKKKRWK